MSDEVKLLPCPFCGGEPTVQHEGFNAATIVRCVNCHLRIIDTTDRMAFAKWQTRPPIGTDEVVERVARALYQTTACEAERTALDCAVPGFDEDDEDARQFCRELARAAIAAMKDAASDGGS